MLVKDHQEDSVDPTEKTFMLVLFTINAHVYPCKLVKFIEGSFGGIWNANTAEKAFTHLKGKEDLFINCFFVEDDLLILLTWYNITFFNRSLEVVKSIGTFMIDRSVRNIDCCNFGMSTRETPSFLVSCNVLKDQMTSA